MKLSLKLAAILTPLAFPTTSFAALKDLQDGADAAKPTGASGNLFGNGGLFQTISNILIFLVGAIAVIMIIIGAFRFVLSAGNPANAKAARDTILYGVIGVAVAIAAYAIVNFVITSLT